MYGNTNGKGEVMDNMIVCFTQHIFEIATVLCITRVRTHFEIFELRLEKLIMYFMLNK